MQWWTKFGLLHKLSEGGWEIRLPIIEPDHAIPFIWINHTLGDAVLTIMKHYGDLIGRTFNIMTALASFNDIAALLAEGIFNYSEVLKTPLYTNAMLFSFARACSIHYVRD